MCCVCVVLPWVGIFCSSLTMMSMVYLSSRPLTQSEFDTEEICPEQVVGVGRLEGRKSGGVCYFQIFSKRDWFPTTIWYWRLCVCRVMCRCDLCSRLCRAAVWRANDDDDPLAQPNWPPTSSLQHVHPQTSSHTAAALSLVLSRRVSLSPPPILVALHQHSYPRAPSLPHQRRH
jgi:hypothetical protein